MAAGHPDIEDQDVPSAAATWTTRWWIPAGDMCQKIRAAVDSRTDDDFVIIVRTDALAVTGLDDTLHRCQEYVKAGADVLFIEAIRTPEEIDRVTREFDVPLLYNFVEKGKSPLIPAPELEELGFKIVIYPGAAMFTVCKVIGGVMEHLKAHGTTEALLDDMVSPVEFFETVGLSEMLAFDARFAAVPQP